MTATTTERPATAKRQRKPRATNRPAPATGPAAAKAQLGQLLADKVAEVAAQPGTEVVPASGVGRSTTGDNRTGRAPRAPRTPATPPAGGTARTPSPGATAVAGVRAFPRYHGTATKGKEVVPCAHRNGHITTDAADKCGRKVVRAQAGDGWAEGHDTFDRFMATVVGAGKELECECAYGHGTEDAAHTCAMALARRNGLKV